MFILIDTFAFHFGECIFGLSLVAGYLFMLGMCLCNLIPVDTKIAVQPDVVQPDDMTKVKNTYPCL